MASPTVAIFSALSSGIEIPNCFSNSMMSYTVSSEAAPRSFVKLASGFTSASSTPSLSTIMSFTFDSISDIIVYLLSCFYYFQIQNRVQSNEFLSECANYF